MSIKHFFLILLSSGLVILFSACDLDDIFPNNLKRETGTWDFGAGRFDSGSLRNRQYTFDLLSDNDTLNISLTSADTEVSLWLFDPLGQQITNPRGGRTEKIFRSNLNKGTYTVIAGTYERYETGDFTLEVRGNVTDLTPVTGSTHIVTGAWETNGGGRFNPGSPRNHVYEVEVLENNTFLDVNQVSDDTDVSLWIYNSLSEEIANPRGGRVEFAVREVNAGKHTIVAGTYERNVLEADYTLNVNGKIGEVVRIPSQDVLANELITNGAGRFDLAATTNHSYTFDVTKNNTAIDIIMESPDFDVCFWVIDPLGELMVNPRGGRSQFTVQATDIGTYEIVCGTYNAGDSGTYKLSLVGYFNNFQGPN